MGETLIVIENMVPNVLLAWSSKILLKANTGKPLSQVSVVDSF